MAISSMAGARSYLYFLNAANTDLTFKADDFLWMEKDGTAALNLYFKSPKFNNATPTDAIA